jgi:hypothetical protein
MARITRFPFARAKLNTEKWFSLPSAVVSDILNRGNCMLPRIKPLNNNKNRLIGQV